MTRISTLNLTENPESRMPGAEKPSDVKKWLITINLMLCMIMSTLDSSVVSVAMPYMQGAFSASIEEIAWVSTAYLLANVITIPIVAAFSSHFGRKNFLLFSIALFVVGSALCGTASSLNSIIVFRVLQGIGGAALTTITQAVLREIFPREEQGMAMGIFGMGVVLGPALGPVVGGWFTDNLSWQWIFLINIPIGVINLAMVFYLIDDPPYFIRNLAGWDWIGLVLIAVGLGSFQLLLEQGEKYDWFTSNYIISLAVISVMSLALFVWRELSVRNPLVDLRILRNRTFTVATLIGGIMHIGLYCSVFGIPLFLQQVIGFSSLDAGIIVMPRAMAMIIMFPLAGYLYNYLGAVRIISLGLAIGCYSFYMLAQLSLGVGYWDMFLPQFIQGVAFGMIFVGVSTAAMSTVMEHEMTLAASLYNSIRNIFSSIGIALFAIQLTSGVKLFYTGFGSHISQNDLITMSRVDVLKSSIMAYTSDPSMALQMAFGTINSWFIRQVTMLAYNRAFILISILFIITIPAVFLLKNRLGR